MSAGEVMLVAFLGICAFTGMAFVLLVAMVILDALTELLQRAGVPCSLADVISAVIIGCLVAFFLWFIFRFPAMPYMRDYGETGYYEQPIEMRD